MYIDKIIEEIKKEDKNFTCEKNWGKIIIEISYVNGKYHNDSFNKIITNKRM